LGFWFFFYKHYNRIHFHYQALIVSSIFQRLLSLVTHTLRKQANNQDDVDDDEEEQSYKSFLVFSWQHFRWKIIKMFTSKVILLNTNIYMRKCSWCVIMLQFFHYFESREWEKLFKLPARFSYSLLCAASDSSIKKLFIYSENCLLPPPLNGRVNEMRVYFSFCTKYILQNDLKRRT
jgi:hypothetical protein